VDRDRHTRDEQPSPYLAFYGLAREPFASRIEFDLFYAEPVRAQRLDILHHLTPYSDELLLVTGPEGSGKSTLLQQYAARASETWEVLRVEARGGIDERNLIQQIYRQLELNFHGATHPELLEQLQHHLDALLHNARQGVLVVDDAEQLTVTALQRILQLASLRSFTDRPLLRVILFGEAALLERLDDPLLTQYASMPRRIIDLPPFSEAHSTHYLLHRLSAARFVAGEPFTEAALHRLYKQSEGWPGRLNALAHQLLLDSLPRSERPPELPGISDRDLYKPGRLIAVGVTIVALLGYIAWDLLGGLSGTAPETPPPATKETAKAVSEDVPARIRQPLPIPAADDERGASMDEAIATVTGKSPAVPADGPAYQPHPLGGKAMPAAASREEEPRLKAAPPGDEPSKQAAAAATRAAAPPAPKPVPAKAGPPPAKPAAKAPGNKRWKPLPAWVPSHRNAWLLARDPRHYTLQLVAGERLDTLRKFIERHGLKRNLAFYRTSRKGKPWYALVYGDYPDKQAAIDARSRLPAKLKREKPWVRDFAGIQKTLKQATSPTPAVD